MRPARPTFHRELRTEINGRLGAITCRGHLSLVLHGYGTLTVHEERELFTAALQEAIRDLNDPARKEDP